MKIYGEWLEKFRVKIEEGYKVHRMDERLCEFAYEGERPARTLWKYDEPPTAQAKNGMTMMTMPIPKFRQVEPIQVGFNIDLGWRFLEEDMLWSLESMMYRFGSRVAEKEYWAIVKGISDNAGETIHAEKKGSLSTLDIREAKSLIGRNARQHADMVVMPLEQEIEFLKKSELWLPNRIPTGYVSYKDRGPYFAGMVNGTKTYWMRFLKDFAVVYAKHEVMVRNTKIEMYFDDEKRPRFLIIEKECSSAPVLDQAVVKIAI